MSTSNNLSKFFLNRLIIYAGKVILIYMENANCIICKNPGDLVCLCNNSIHCYKCIGKHLIENPLINHNPAILKHFYSKTLLDSSLNIIKEKEMLNEPHNLKIDKAVEERIQKEFCTIDRFVSDSLKKLKKFSIDIRIEIQKHCSQLEEKIKNYGENYKNSLSSNQSLLESIKRQPSEEIIENLEISSLVFNLTYPNISAIINESINFELNIIQNPSEAIAEISPALISIDSEDSPSDESRTFKRSRTRVPTKIKKKGLPVNIYCCIEGNLVSYNIHSSEIEYIEMDVNKLCVSTMTDDGSIVITGGFRNSSVYIYNIIQKTIEKTESMLANR